MARHWHFNSCMNPTFQAFSFFAFLLVSGPLTWADSTSQEAMQVSCENSLTRDQKLSQLQFEELLYLFRTLGTSSTEQADLRALDGADGASVSPDRKGPEALTLEPNTFDETKAQPPLGSLDPGFIGPSFTSFSGYLVREMTRAFPMSDDLNRFFLSISTTERGVPLHLTELSNPRYNLYLSLSLQTLDPYKPLGVNANLALGALQKYISHALTNQVAGFETAPENLVPEKAVRFHKNFARNFLPASERPADRRQVKFPSIKINLALLTPEALILIFKKMSYFLKELESGRLHELIKKKKRHPKITPELQEPLVFPAPKPNPVSKSPILPGQELVGDWKRSEECCPGGEYNPDEEIHPLFKERREAEDDSSAPEDQSLRDWQLRWGEPEEGFPDRDDLIEE